MLRFAALVVTMASPAVGASAPEWAARVRDDVAAMAAGPSLSAWQGAHAGDRLEPAHNGPNDSYEIDYAHTDRWCAAALSNGPAQVFRAALFYTPEAKRGALPPLPESGGPALLRECRIEALWFQTREPLALDLLVKGLSAVWGDPHGPAQIRSNIRGCGLWRNTASWRLPDVEVWAAYDPGMYHPQGARTIVFARRTTLGAGSLVRPMFDEAFAKRVTEAAIEAAGLGRRAPDTVDDLERWLAGAALLPPARKAAALLVADAFQPPSPAADEHLRKLGMRFAPACPQDGPVYSHNLRAEAERLDPGELTGLACLMDPCSLRGKGSWPDLAIAKAGQLLIRFPNGRWAPWFHYAAARAHALKLAFADPAVETDDGTHPLTAEEQRGERLSAIDHFRDFLRLAPDAPETEFAWQEAWRLLAGLPPSLAGFGCSCE